MPSFTFVSVDEEGSNTSMTFNTVFLSHVVDKMEQFLKGSGFYFKELKVVVDKDTEVDLDLS